MIPLPSIFATANKQDKKQADVLVMIEDVTLFAEKTTETDWGNNAAENQVDYTSPDPSAGDVILDREATPSIVTEYLTGGDSWYQVDNFLNSDSTAQGFKVVQDGLEMDSIEYI